MKSLQETRQQLLQLLARREYSARELQQKLQDGHDEENIATVLAQLQAQGLQSDHRYAEMWVRHRRQQGYGPIRIQGELRQKGISSELARECLDDGTDWFDSARACRERRFGSGRPDDIKARAKQVRFLQYRGFSADQIRFALEADG